VSSEFPPIYFDGTLRPSQRDVAKIAREQLERGERRLHIVAPPGSGKTVVGLYLWAECVKTPALVLSPNSAIQAQWAARTSLFKRRDNVDIAADISTSGREPGLLTSLTYQSVTMPAGASSELDGRALDLWIEVLLENDQAESYDAGQIWIHDLRVHNPDYYNQRLGHYRKRIRDDDAMSGQAIESLHQSAQRSLEKLKDANVGLLILDECHHLLGHWGRVLAEVGEYFGDPVIVGLTATPPDRGGKKQYDIDRYDNFFGSIDYEVPVPAVVKDGFLAPYQDLAYFVRPTADELAYIARADSQFEQVVLELCQPRENIAPEEPIVSATDEETSSGSESLSETPGSETSSKNAQQRESLLDWLQRVLTEKRTPTGVVNDWRAFHRRDPDFAAAAVRFLTRKEIELPPDVPYVPMTPDDDIDTMLITVLDRYVRHCLRRSPHPEDHDLAEKAIDRLRLLGVQITDTGHRPCASPVSRVIAYTQNKTAAIVPILSTEMDLLGDDTRAVIIADFEKTSATSTEVAHLLDDEAGGAVAAFRAVLSNEKTNKLDPILLTGSTVLVDSDLSERIVFEAGMWLEERSMFVELKRATKNGFCVISGSGKDWCPRVYVELLTEMFQRGLSRCLVGTRGLLGEGWDANTINVLIDLSTVTTSMTVNQLRGRSIRLNPKAPKKLSNNWDIVCIAPEFKKGLDDYHRFIRKHKTLFGICDDGAIEKGVGHVHAAFTELKPELLDGSVTALNADMLERAKRRETVYSQWKIGEPYSAEPVKAVEIRTRSGQRMETPEGPQPLPPFKGSNEPWTRKSFALAVGEAVLAALYETDQLQGAWPVHVSERDGGFVRVFLEDAGPEDADLFAVSFREALGPLSNPRYVIPRSVDYPKQSFFRKLLPSVIRRFFESRNREMVMLHAVPTALANKRDVVDIYQKYWNQFVSPGEAVYSKNKDGEQLINNAVRDGEIPDTIVHDKEIFM
jgi:superfamily II DNA or RNA helicase